MTSAEDGSSTGAPPSPRVPRVPRHTVIAAYVGARRRRFADRQQLARWQQPRLERALRRARTAYPFYAQVPEGGLAAFPILDKRTWLEHFQQLNARGLTLDECLTAARMLEQQRRFDTRLRGLSVGLSTGTSGRQGAFLTSGRERAVWAGTILARALPDGLRRRERVALVLRAGGPLYESVGSALVSFRFVDLYEPLVAQAAALQDVAPTVLAAPPVLLDRLATLLREGRLRISPRLVYSVADVLDPEVAARVEAAFGVPLGQIYQATEGFLGITCRHGTMHLNEDLLVVEREEIDTASGRFVPIVTDLWRTSQAVVRFRMGDVLVPAPQCPCGSGYAAIARIEGRSDDVLLLPAAGSGSPPGSGPGDGGLSGGVAGASREGVSVFADSVRAAVLGVADVADFRLTQLAPDRVRLAVDPAQAHPAAVAALDALWQRAGVRPPIVEQADHEPLPSAAKARRVRREF